MVCGHRGVIEDFRENVGGIQPKEYIDKVTVEEIGHIGSSCLPDPRRLCE